MSLTFPEVLHTHNHIELTTLDSESAIAIVRAVDDYGSDIAQELHLPASAADAVIETSREVMRATVRDSYSGDRYTISRVFQTTATFEKGETLDEAKTAIMEEAENVVAAPETRSVTSEEVKFIALCLDRGLKKTKESSTKTVLNTAMEELARAPHASRPIERALHPETSKRVRLASIMGAHVSRLIARQVMKPHLAYR